MRRRQKTPREERPSAPIKPTNTYIGEDNYDYPQIKVDDLSSSPTSSPERSTSTLEIQPSRASPASDIESVERKIYKAYKWLRYSYISYSNNKDGETSLVTGEADEGRAGTSHKDNPAPSSSMEACLNTTVPQRNQDLPPEGCSKDAFKEGTLARNPSSGPTLEHSSHPWAEVPEGTSQDTNSGGSLEHPFETKKLNGKALSKVLSSRAEEPPSPPLPKSSGTTLNSGSGNCPRTQSDDSEERSLETICANHNNGRLHPRPSHPHNNGQNFGELEMVASSSPGRSDTDHDNSSLSGTLLHKDCCGSEVACEAPSAGTKEDPTDPSATDSSRAVYGYSGLKRHRVELEDTDSENSSSEKKLKT
jgi:WD repeat-containing protein 22